VLKGFGGGGVIELRVRDIRSNAYRTVYAANLGAAIYVLHAFQKKSTKGIKTSRRDIDMIDRLRDAREIDRARAAEEENDDAR
jgi:phage-related protein